MAQVLGSLLLHGLHVASPVQLDRGAELPDQCILGVSGDAQRSPAWPCRLSVRDVSTGKEQICYPAADIDLSCKLSDLQPGTSYELKVGPCCQAASGSHPPACRKP